MMGAAKLDPRGTPDPSTLQGGEHRYVEDEIAVQNVLTGAYTVLTTQARIKIPSARLSTAVTLGFHPNDGEDPVVSAGWVATIRAWKRTKSGIYIRANDVLVGQAMPFTYEATTSVDEWRIDITAPNAPGTTMPVGVWYLVGTWEPAAGQVIPEPELQKLFQLCRVQVTSPLITSQFGV